MNVVENPLTPQNGAGVNVGAGPSHGENAGERPSSVNPPNGYWIPLAVSGDRNVRIVCFLNLIFFICITWFFFI